MIEDAADMAVCGIVFAPPQIDRERCAPGRIGSSTRLTNGLNVLAKQRKVDVLRGEAKFVGPHSLELQVRRRRRKRVDFKQCIIAAGSESVRLPGIS